MKLYNTASRTIEIFTSLIDGKVGLYACGPTVYDYAHLGHLRKYTMDDVLVRVLKKAGYTVTHVQNITDVGHLVSDGDTGEDKMEKGAAKYGKSVWDIAKEFEDFFWKSLDTLRIGRPDVSARATEYIFEQIALIKTLEEKGYAYTIADGVYFDTSRFPTYGALSNLDPEALQAGARVEMVEGKRKPTDFALWKLSPEHQQRQMEWESPWGKGFPGWHIECSAMSMKFLGEQFDIHTGGIDHIPVHHANEIAQSEAATGKHPFVRFWVHHNFLRVDGQKMSKSLGNFFTIDDVINKGYIPMALKLFFLSSHYRSEQNFTWEALDASQKAYDRLIAIMAQCKRETERTVLSDEKLEKINGMRLRFFSALEDDLHTPEAMSVVWEAIKSNIPGKDKYDLVLEFDTILGLGIEEAAREVEETTTDVPSGVQMLLDQRLQARAVKDFATADMLRLEIAKLGWNVEDTAAGQQIKKQ